MKTIGRILIILAVFAVVMGITYEIVTSRSPSSSAFTQRLEAGNGQFASPEGAAPGFPNNERAEFPAGARNEFHAERGGQGWLSGALKNVAIIAILVTVVVVPKSWIQKRRREMQIASGSKIGDAS